MRVSLLCLTLAVALSTATPALAAKPCDGPGHGKLLIQGGGGAPEEYTAKGLQLCGGPGSRVVVVAYATGNLHPHSKGEIEYDVLVAMLKKSWTDAGAINVTVLDLETDHLHCLLWRRRRQSSCSLSLLS